MTKQTNSKKTHATQNTPKLWNITMSGQRITHVCADLVVEAPTLEEAQTLVWEMWNRDDIQFEEYDDEDVDGSFNIESIEPAPIAITSADPTQHTHQPDCRACAADQAPASTTVH